MVMNKMAVFQPITSTMMMMETQTLFESLDCVTVLTLTVARDRIFLCAAGSCMSSLVAVKACLVLHPAVVRPVCYVTSPASLSPAISILLISSPLVIILMMFL
jgi:hypothetical protein